jgi:hypothetical protein
VARIDDYKESFRLAMERMKDSNPERMASLAGAEFRKPHNGASAELCLPFLTTRYLVSIGPHGVDVTREGDESEVSLPEKILIAHYLLHATGSPPSGELIAFRQVPDGHFYDDAFKRRARDPLLSTFGTDPELLRECAAELGGIAIEAGDVGMVFRVFPNISVQLVLWKGDDEFPPDAGILFDSNIRSDLPAEDIAVMSGMLVYRLMGIARNLQATRTSPPPQTPSGALQ